jgi:glycine dehydrogenase subunit 2
MITNPNTLGLFEEHIGEICEIVHGVGGLVYCDGANMNSILGLTRPGDWGVDVMHFNLHKTFSTPHGGGGPGAGPICVTEALEPFLPSPRISRRDDGSFFVNAERDSSIGKLRTFFGQFLVLVRAYTYIKTLGGPGLKQVAERAVLNANYLRALLSDDYEMAFEAACMHECIFSDKGLAELGVSTMDVAKRLIDYGFHPPTVYFPLIVKGALMVEPTETESKHSLDNFADAMIAIRREAEESPELLRNAPTAAFRSRLDETRAARRPVLTVAMVDQGSKNQSV